MNRTKKIIISSWGLWGCLGFYRGHTYYNKEHTQQLKYQKNKQYNYITHFGFCLAGTIFYTSPFTMIPTFLVELYNLEEYIRGIKIDY